MTTRAPEQQPEESGHGVRIARVGGVPVYLAPSWFLIAAVIVAIVATPYFPDRVVMRRHYVTGLDPPTARWAILVRCPTPPPSSPMPPTS